MRGEFDDREKLVLKNFLAFSTQQDPELKTELNRIICFSTKLIICLRLLLQKLQR